jgi:hypothetical protein
MLIVAVSSMIRPALVVSAAEGGTARNVIMLFAGVVALSAVGLYAIIGEPRAVDTGHGDNGTRAPLMAAMAATRSNADRKAGSVAQLLGGLEARLEQDPADGKGWLLLAKSYEHLGRLADARDAYRKAESLGITDSAFSETLSEPDRQGDGYPLQGRVSLGPSADGIVEPGDTVFVVAKDPEGGPMPLAVIRRSAADLPFDFVLDESASMVPGKKLRDADTVVVSARVSRSGDALDTAPGLGADSSPVDPARDGYVALVIQQKSTGTGPAE